MLQPRGTPRVLSAGHESCESAEESAEASLPRLVADAGKIRHASHLCMCVCACGRVCTLRVCECLYVFIYELLAALCI